MGRNGTRDMTVGPPAGHILYFALPLLAGSLLQQLYNMVDSWVVGRYVGDGALAAVGVGFPVLTMFSSLFIGLSSGGTVVIAQFFGAGKMDRVRDAVDTIYAAFLLSIVPLTVLALLAVGPILRLLQVEAAAYDEAYLYLMVVCAGLIGSVGYNLNAGILGGLGNSRSTLLFLAVASGMNIVLDLVLVLSCGLGVLGVALGTIIAQAASWLFGVVYIGLRYPQISLRLLPRKFDRALFGQIMGIGLPAGVQMSLVALGAMVVMGKINTYGKEFTAGYNVGFRLDQLAFLPIQSLSSAVISFVGQNIGAKEMDRARQGIRITVLLSAAWAVLMTAALMPFSEPLVAFFSGTPEVVHAGAVYLRCIMPFYVMFAVMFCLNNAMRGAGDSVFPMVDVILSLILVRVPAVYYLADRFGPDYMYYGCAVGWTVGLALSVGWYLSGRWKRHGSLADEGEGGAPGL
ncbi:MATE family efflux transporter [uncultured Oscillibacter sp.]|uniref:MATE family efflux transporter n=1 Tax=uncultured Oscillibacter sp. TaxID=876091 RepID=UPI0025D39B26|nr:MATE family efflux transporter [uncultured Oscillibacter sp.]